MNKWTGLLATIAAFAFASSATAQTQDAVPPVTAMQELSVQEVQERNADVDRRMYEAERRMAEAARQIAELTNERLPRMEGFERRIEFLSDDRPRLGVTIGGDERGAVKGVSIVGVTPGSGADDAGLRSGDVITSINGESLGAPSAEESMAKLLDFMSGVEHGDTLALGYLRDGKSGEVEVEPKPTEHQVFAFAGDGRGFRVPIAPDIEVIPGVPSAAGAPRQMVFHWSSDGWGDMELVELNEGLGKYFGTEEGLLVVSAPESMSLQLLDGDVIQKIDGREPTSVRHALRILGSYQAGESLKLEIMRDKKRRTLDVEIPNDLSSGLMPSAPAVEFEVVPARPVLAPAPARVEPPPAEIERT